MRLAVLWVLLLSASGCLPYGCNRTESRLISPADSLSRAYAETVPVDTLAYVGTLHTAFEYPRTLGYGPDGTLFVTDAAAHRLVAAGPDGSERVTGLDTLRYPYLAGFVDTVPLVYSPEAHRVVAVAPAGASWSLPTPEDGPVEGALRYALADESGVWIKVLGPDFAGYVGHLDSTGTVDCRVDLPGPHWRYAGLLRSWMGEPVSLSGYLPLVHRVTDAGLDSTALFGFDSPMLARTRQFVMGTVDAPPLLTAAAASVDSTLFVLNMRPGWLRVEAYGPEGRLKAVFVEPDPTFNQDFFPTDLAVRADSTGRFDLAVAVTEPEPEVRLYRWTGR